MKDYKLSEVKAICEEHYIEGKWCENCPFDQGQFCEITGMDYQPFLWDIDKESKDDKQRMVE